ncbi:histone deacetylase [Candidatus Fermentibacteria bacterium]|nr:histone deacetylase [Candidatus Fermentibacteria bacterium]
MSRTAYYWDPISLEHDTGAHAEHMLRADRLRPEKIAHAIDGVAFRPVEPHDTAEWICRIHDRQYHDWVKEVCRSGGGLLDGGDTPASARSYDAALASVDAVLTAADAIMAGELDTAFSAMRPPGHHALPPRAMGFCIFSNVGILVRYLEEKYRIGRLAVVDFDVHHGNGTQHVFWRDPDVLYVSLHQFPLFPGTGAARDEGDGPGLGTTLNIPFSPGTTEGEYLAKFEAKVLPAVDAFGPEFLIISAGFDGHVADPLADLRLTEDGYAWMTRELKSLATEWCQGRIISVLEGGYNLDALVRCVAAHVQALRG